MITADTAPVLFIFTYLIVVQMAGGFLTPSTVVTEGASLRQTSPSTWEGIQPSFTQTATPSTSRDHLPDVIVQQSSKETSPLLSSLPDLTALPTAGSSLHRAGQAVISPMQTRTFQLSSDILLTSSQTSGSRGATVAASAAVEPGGDQHDPSESRSSVMSAAPAVVEDVQSIEAREAVGSHSGAEFPAHAFRSSVHDDQKLSVILSEANANSLFVYSSETIPDIPVATTSPASTAEASSSRLSGDITQSTLTPDLQTHFLISSQSKLTDFDLNLASSFFESTESPSLSSYMTDHHNLRTGDSGQGTTVVEESVSVQNVPLHNTLDSDASSHAFSVLSVTSSFPRNSFSSSTSHFVFTGTESSTTSLGLDSSHSSIDKEKMNELESSDAFEKFRLIQSEITSFIDKELSAPSSSSSSGRSTDGVVRPTATSASAYSSSYIAQRENLNADLSSVLNPLFPSSVIMTNSLTPGETEAANGIATSDAVVSGAESLSSAEYSKPALSVSPDTDMVKPGAVTAVAASTRTPAARPEVISSGQTASSSADAVRSSRSYSQPLGEEKSSSLTSGLASGSRPADVIPSDVWQTVTVVNNTLVLTTLFLGLRLSPSSDVPPLSQPATAALSEQTEESSPSLTSTPGGFLPEGSVTSTARNTPTASSSTETWLLSAPLSAFPGSSASAASMTGLENLAFSSVTQSVSESDGFGRPNLKLHSSLESSVSGRAALPEASSDVLVSSQSTLLQNSLVSSGDQTPDPFVMPSQGNTDSFESHVRIYASSTPSAGSVYSILATQTAQRGPDVESSTEAAYFTHLESSDYQQGIDPSAEIDYPPVLQYSSHALPASAPRSSELFDESQTAETDIFPASSAELSHTAASARLSNLLISGSRDVNRTLGISRTSSFEQVDQTPVSSQASITGSLDTAKSPAPSKPDVVSSAYSAHRNLSPPDTGVHTSWRGTDFAQPEVSTSQSLLSLDSTSPLRRSHSDEEALGSLGSGKFVSSTLVTTALSVAPRGHWTVQNVGRRGASSVPRFGSDSTVSLRSPDSTSPVRDKDVSLETTFTSEALPGSLNVGVGSSTASRSHISDMTSHTIVLDRSSIFESTDVFSDRSASTLPADFVAIGSDQPHEDATIDLLQPDGSGMSESTHVGLVTDSRESSGLDPGLQVLPSHLTSDAPWAPASSIPQRHQPTSDPHLESAGVTMVQPYDSAGSPSFGSEMDSVSVFSVRGASALLVSQGTADGAGFVHPTLLSSSGGSTVSADGTASRERDSGASPLDSESSVRSVTNWGTTIHTETDGERISQLDTSFSDLPEEASAPTSSVYSSESTFGEMTATVFDFTRSVMSAPGIDDWPHPRSSSRQSTGGNAETSHSPVTERIRSLISHGLSGVPTSFSLPTNARSTGSSDLPSIDAYSAFTQPSTLNHTSSSSMERYASSTAGVLASTETSYAAETTPEAATPTRSLPGDDSSSQVRVSSKRTSAGSLATSSHVLSDVPSSVWSGAATSTESLPELQSARAASHSVSSTRGLAENPGTGLELGSSALPEAQSSTSAAPPEVYLLTWSFHPHGQDLDSPVFLGQIKRGLEMSFTLGRSRLHLRVKRNAEPTDSEASVMFQSLTRHQDGGASQTFTVEEGGRLLPASEVARAFSMVSNTEMSASTGVRVITSVRSVLVPGDSGVPSTVSAGAEGSGGQTSGSRVGMTSSTEGTESSSSAAWTRDAAWESGSPDSTLGHPQSSQARLQHLEATWTASALRDLQSSDSSLELSVTPSGASLSLGQSALPATRSPAVDADSDRTQNVFLPPSVMSLRAEIVTVMNSARSVEIYGGMTPEPSESESGFFSFTSYTEGDQFQTKDETSESTSVIASASLHDSDFQRSLAEYIAPSPVSDDPDMTATFPIEKHSLSASAGVSDAWGTRGAPSPAHPPPSRTAADEELWAMSGEQTTTAMFSRRESEATLPSTFSISTSGPIATLGHDGLRSETSTPSASVKVSPVLPSPTQSPGIFSSQPPGVTDNSRDSLSSVTAVRDELGTNSDLTTTLNSISSSPSLDSSSSDAFSKGGTSSFSLDLSTSAVEISELESIGVTPSLTTGSALTDVVSATRSAPHSKVTEDTPPQPLHSASISGSPGSGHSVVISQPGSGGAVPGTASEVEFQASTEVSSHTSVLFVGGVDTVDPSSAFLFQATKEVLSEATKPLFTGVESSRVTSSRGNTVFGDRGRISSPVLTVTPITESGGSDVLMPTLTPRMLSDSSSATQDVSVAEVASLSPTSAGAVETAFSASSTLDSSLSSSVKEMTFYLATSTTVGDTIMSRASQFSETLVVSEDSPVVLTSYMERSSSSVVLLTDSSSWPTSSTDSTWHPSYASDSLHLFSTENARREFATGTFVESDILPSKTTSSLMSASVHSTPLVSEDILSATSDPSATTERIFLGATDAQMASSAEGFTTSPQMAFHSVLLTSIEGSMSSEKVAIEASLPVLQVSFLTASTVRTKGVVSESERIEATPVSSLTQKSTAVGAAPPLSVSPLSSDSDTPARGSDSRSSVPPTPSPSSSSQSSTASPAATAYYFVPTFTALTSSLVAESQASESTSTSLPSGIVIPTTATVSDSPLPLLSPTRSTEVTDYSTTAAMEFSLVEGSDSSVTASSSADPVLSRRVTEQSVTSSLKPQFPRQATPADASAVSASQEFTIAPTVSTSHSETQNTELAGPSGMTGASPFSSSVVSSTLGASAVSDISATPSISSRSTGVQNGDLRVATSVEASSSIHPVSETLFASATFATLTTLGITDTSSEIFTLTLESSFTTLPSSSFIKSLAESTRTLGSTPSYFTASLPPLSSPSAVDDVSPTTVPTLPSTPHRSVASINILSASPSALFPTATASSLALHSPSISTVEDHPSYRELSSSSRVVSETTAPDVEATWLTSRLPGSWERAATPASPIGTESSAWTSSAFHVTSATPMTSSGASSLARDAPSGSVPMPGTMSSRIPAASLTPSEGVVSLPASSSSSYSFSASVSTSEWFWTDSETGFASMTTGIFGSSGATTESEMSITSNTTMPTGIPSMPSENTEASTVVSESRKTRLVEETSSRMFRIKEPSTTFPGFMTFTDFMPSGSVTETRSMETESLPLPDGYLSISPTSMEPSVVGSTEAKSFSGGSDVSKLVSSEPRIFELFSLSASIVFLSSRIDISSESRVETSSIFAIADFNKQISPISPSSSFAESVSSVTLERTSVYSGFSPGAPSLPLNSAVSPSAPFISSATVSSFMAPADLPQDSSPTSSLPAASGFPALATEPLPSSSAVLSSDLFGTGESFGTATETSCSTACASTVTSVLSRLPWTPLSEPSTRVVPETRAESPLAASTPSGLLTPGSTQPEWTTADVEASTTSQREALRPTFSWGNTAWMSSSRAPPTLDFTGGQQISAQASASVKTESEWSTATRSDTESSAVSLDADSGRFASVFPASSSLLETFPGTQTVTVPGVIESQQVTVNPTASEYPVSRGTEPQWIIPESSVTLRPTESPLAVPTFAVSRSSDSVRPTTVEFPATPTTHNAVRPSTPDAARSTTPDLVLPTTLDMIRPTTLGSIGSSILDVVHPTISDSVRPSTLGSVRPTTLGSVRPTTLGSVRPTTLGSVRPTALGSVRPSTLASVRPSTLDIDYPTSDSFSPTTPDSVHPTALDSIRYSTLYIVHPTISDSVRPATSESVRPSTIDHPISSDSIRPSSSERVRLSTLYIVHPTISESIPTTMFDSIRPTTSDSIRPTTSDSIRPTTSESIRPTTPHIIRPTTPDSIRPTTPDSIPPTTSDSIRPTTPDSVRPTTSDSVRPTTFESIRPTTPHIIRPTTSESILPTTSDSIRPTTSDSIRPTTSDSIRPTTPHIIRPTTSDSILPTTSDSIRPTTSDSIRPTTPHIIRPTTPDSIRPTTSDSIRPTTSDSDRPTIPESILPTTSESVRPSTIDHPISSDSVRPSSSESVRLSTLYIVHPTTSESIPTTMFDRIRPTTSDSIRPTTSDSIRPTTPHIIRPTTSDSIRPTTSDSDRPTIPESILPTTSESVRPSTIDHPIFSDSVRPSSSESVRLSTLYIVHPTTSESIPTTMFDRIRPTTSDSIPPTTSDSIRPTTSDSIRPTTPHIIRPTTHDSIRPTTSDSIRPTTSDSIRPTTSDSIRPTTSDSIRPTTSEGIRPTTSEGIRPTTPDNIRPTTSDSIRPTTSEGIRPTTPDNIRPTTSDSIRPTTSEGIRPTTSEGIRPTTPDNIRPTTSDSIRPTTSEGIRPTTPDNIRPTTSDSIRPTTPESIRPTTSDSIRPTTPDSIRPTIPDSIRPTTSDSTRPTTPDSIRPTTSEGIRPTTSYSIRPTTPDSIRPTIPDSIRPTTSDSTRPAIHETVRPTIADSVRTSTPERVRPTSPESVRPATSEMLGPTTLDSVFPRTTDSLRPSTPDSALPSTLESVHPSAPENVRPTSSESVRPSTLESDGPTTSERISPTTLESDRPKTSESVSPTTPEGVHPTTDTVLPSITESVHPSTPESVHPTIPESVHPTTPEISRPTTSDSVRPSIPDSIHPSSLEPVETAIIPGISSLRPTTSATAVTTSTTINSSVAVSTQPPAPPSSPPTTLPPTTLPPGVDNLLLLKMEVPTNVIITEKQFLRTVEKGLTESYLNALASRRKREAHTRFRRQGSIHVQVTGVRRGAERRREVEAEFYVEERGRAVPSKAALTQFLKLSQNQMSAILGYPVLGSVEAVGQVVVGQGPPEAPGRDTFFVVAIVLPCILLSLLLLLLAARLCYVRRKQHPSAARVAPARYNRGDALADFNLTVDVEKGEIVDGSPSGSPLPNRSTYKRQDSGSEGRVSPMDTLERLEVKRCLEDDLSQAEELEHPGHFGTEAEGVGIDLDRPDVAIYADSVTSPAPAPAPVPPPAPVPAPAPQPPAVESIVPTQSETGEAIRSSRKASLALSLASSPSDAADRDKADRTFRASEYRQKRRPSRPTSRKGSRTSLTSEERSAEGTGGGVKAARRKSKSSIGSGDLPEGDGDWRGWGRRRSGSFCSWEDADADDVSRTSTLSSSATMTSVTSISSEDHTDASDEFTVIFPRSRSARVTVDRERGTIVLGAPRPRKPSSRKGSGSGGRRARPDPLDADPQDRRPSLGAEQSDTLPSHATGEVEVSEATLPVSCLAMTDSPTSTYRSERRKYVKKSQSPQKRVLKKERRSSTESTSAQTPHIHAVEVPAKASSPDLVKDAQEMTSTPIPQLEPIAKMGRMGTPRFQESPQEPPCRMEFISQLRDEDSHSLLDMDPSVCEDSDTLPLSSRLPFRDPFPGEDDPSERGEDTEVPNDPHSELATDRTVPDLPADKTVSETAPADVEEAATVVVEETKGSDMLSQAGSLHSSPITPLASQSEAASVKLGRHMRAHPGKERLQRTPTAEELVRAQELRQQLLQQTEHYRREELQRKIAINNDNRRLLSQELALQENLRRERQQMTQLLDQAFLFPAVVENSLQTQDELANPPDTFPHFAPTPSLPPSNHWRGAENSEGEHDLDVQNAMERLEQGQQD